MFKRHHKQTLGSIYCPEPRKEAIKLSATGYLQINAYTSNAKIPVKDAAVTITGDDDRIIAFRLTNRSGQLDEPIPITVPDLIESQEPNPPERPFSTVNLYARAEDYEMILVEDVQIFADTQTDQNLELIPLSEFPESYNKEEIFITTPQAL